MSIKVTANNTNGNLPGLVEWFDDIERAKKHADWWHGQSSVCNVEITEPLGVRLTDADGQAFFEPAMSMAEAIDARDSWQGVIDNRRNNRTRVRKVEIVNLPPEKTAVATPEDTLVGAWMAAALDDHTVSPVMKYDINRWLDSKDWT